MNRDEERIYSFPLPVVCSGQTLDVTITVDKMVSLPSFITSSVVSTFEGDFVRIKFDQTIDDSDAGTYNLKVKVAKSN